MIKWIVEFAEHNKIEKWFDKLTKEQLLSVAKEIKLLELCGNTLKMPHSKPLKKGIYELRERKFGFRVYYTFFSQKIILLTAGDKSSQRRDIANAIKILSEVTNEKI